MANWRRTRLSKARSSSNEKTLLSDSMGEEWRTSVSCELGAPPTRCVGESGVRSSGCSFSSATSSAYRRVVFSVGDLWRVQLVVEPAGPLDLLAQLRGARLGVS